MPIVRLQHGCNHTITIPGTEDTGDSGDLAKQSLQLKLTVCGAQLIASIVNVQFLHAVCSVPPVVARVTGFLIQAELNL